MSNRYGHAMEPRIFHDIVDPDAEVGPPWVRRLARRFEMPGGLTAATATVALLAGIAVTAATGPAIGLVVGAGLVGGTGIAGVVDWRLGRNRVSGRHPALAGQPIVGEGLELLVDISKRFAFAQRKVGELPTLVDWDDIAPAVEAIRWDAARHAAVLSASEDRWRDVAHAPPGTPQAALRARIAAERADELEILRGYQRTADRLMNRAADAAAAAVVASELGFDLDVASPSASASRATATLEAVIERLDALTAAWRALDASTDLTAQLLASEVAQRDAASVDRARRLTDRLDEATGRRATPEEGSG